MFRFTESLSHALSCSPSLYTRITLWADLRGLQRVLSLATHLAHALFDIMSLRNRPLRWILDRWVVKVSAFASRRWTYHQCLSHSNLHIITVTYPLILAPSSIPHSRPLDVHGRAHAITKPDRSEEHPTVGLSRRVTVRRTETYKNPAHPMTAPTRSVHRRPKDSMAGNTADVATAASTVLRALRNRRESA